MKQWRQTGLWWCVGLALMALRLLHNRFGFDSSTGLSVPCWQRPALVAGLVLTAAGSVLLHWRLPRTKAAFGDAFALPERETALLAAGILLLAAGGGLVAVRSALERGGAAALAAGALALAAGGGLLVGLRRLRTGQDMTAAPLLPAMFFSVFFVLAVYLPAADDPVLARYDIQVLATAAAAYAFSQLAGFTQRESSPRRFAITASLAVALCIAALADSVGLPLRLLFAGCGAVLSGFLLLLKRT